MTVNITAHILGKKTLESLQTHTTTMGDTVTCTECGHENEYETLYQNHSSQTKKVELKCTECNNRVTTEFHCGECDTWYGGRVMLKPYDNGSVCKYVCPECDGLIRKGPVLDTRQGQYR